MNVITDWNQETNAATATISFPEAGTYNIYRDGKYVDQVTVGEDEVCEDGYLDADTEYTYKVVSVNEDGEEGASESETVTTPESEQLDGLQDTSVEVEGLDEADLEDMGIADLDMNDPDEKKMIMDILRDNIGGYLSQEMADASNGLHSGDDSASDWFDRIALLLTAGVTLAGIIGSGGTNQFEECQDGGPGCKTEKELNDQFDYLEGFKGEIESGEQDLAGVDARLDLYANVGHVAEAVRTQQAEASGFTRARRILGGNSNHCIQCIVEASKGWVPIDDLVPIGECFCINNCLCEVEYGYEDDEYLPNEEIEDVESPEDYASKLKEKYDFSNE